MCKSNFEKDLFVDEAHELFNKVEKSIESIGRGDELSKHFYILFGSLHTIRGAANYFGYKRLHDHIFFFEQLIESIKMNESLTKGQIFYLLKGVDASKVILHDGDIEFSYCHIDSFKNLKETNFESILTNDYMSSPLEDSFFSGAYSSNENDKICIIDNDKEAATNVEINFLNRGMDVRVFETFLDLKGELNDIRPNLLIVDINSLEVDKNQFFEDIININCFLPVIFISSFIDEKFILKTPLFGSYFFLKRPFDIDELYNICNMAIHRNRVSGSFNKSINFIKYQFKNISKLLEKSGLTSIKESIESEVESLVDQRDFLNRVQLIDFFSSVSNVGRDRHINIDMTKSEQEMKQDMVEEFIVESTSMLKDAKEIISQATLSEVYEKESINEVFRLIHTFKGNCSILSLGDMELLSHKIEDYFSLVLSSSELRKNEYLNSILMIIDIIASRVSKLQLFDIGQINGQDLYVSLLDSILTTERDIKHSDILDKIDIFNNNIYKEKGECQVSKKETGLKHIADNIKVSSLKINQLGSSIEEFVTAKTMLETNIYTSKVNNENIKNNLKFLDRVSVDLQETFMNMKMVPISFLFSRMSGLIDETARILGKEVKVSISGEDIEIDKLILDKLGDPLLHLIRNAIDHGIEANHKRIGIGKKEVAQIKLKAIKHSNEISIIVEDDGKGIDKDKVIKQAIENKLIDSKDDIADDEVLKLIFKSGFSTAEKISSISGRGVGLDVVWSSIQKLKGIIYVSSELGKGTKFEVKIPLSISIILGVTVEAEGTKFSIPITNIQKMGPFIRNIHTVPGKKEKILRQGDEVIPVWFMGGISSCINTELDHDKNVVIVSDIGGNNLAIVVDKIVGQHEIVVKSLPSNFDHLPGYMGCSILGSGEVSVVLDIPEIIAHKSYFIVS